MAYYEGNISDLSTGNNNNGWSDWSWIIGLAVVGGIFGNGWGFGNNGNRSGNCATQADLSAGFANSEIMSDLNDIILGQAQMQNFINQGFAGLNSTINTGFAVALKVLPAESFSSKKCLPLSKSGLKP